MEENKATETEERGRGAVLRRRGGSRGATEAEAGRPHCVPLLKQKPLPLPLHIVACKKLKQSIS